MSSIFFSNSEADASELLESIEDISVQHGDNTRFEPTVDIPVHITKHIEDASELQESLKETFLCYLY